MPTLDITLEPDADDPESIGVFAVGTVDGEPTRFLVDTGAARSRVASSPAVDALPSLGHDGGRGAGGEVVPDDLVRVGSLACGPITARDAVVGRQPPGAPQPMPLLGVDLLAGHRISVRLDAARIDVDEPVPPGTRLLELFTDRGGQPFVDVRLPGAVARGVWDTGAGLTVVDAAFAAQHPALFALGADAGGTDASGAAVASTRATMAACRIGGADFAESAAVVVDLSGIALEMIVGVPLIRQADWLFDFPRRAWAITRRPG